MSVNWLRVSLAGVSLSVVFSGMIPSATTEVFAKADSTSTITVWIHPFMSDAQKQDQLFSKFVNDFQSKNPNIHVNIQTVPWSGWDQKNVTALSASNGGPDVLYLIPDMITQYASKGMLAPLNSLLPNKVKDFSQFTQGAMEGVQYQNKVYGLPFLQSCIGWVYNLDVLKQAGVNTTHLPATWSELESVLMKVKSTGKTPYNFDGGNTPNMTFYPYLWQAGGNVFDHNGKTIVNNAAGLKAMNLLYDFHQKGLFNRDAATSITAGTQFLSGNGAVYMTDNSWDQISSTAKFKWALGPVLKDKQQATYATVGAFAINAKSNQKSAAAKFVEYITSKEPDQQFLTATKYLPPRNDLVHMWKNDPFLDRMTSDAAKYGHPGVINPISRQVVPVVTAQIQAILTGQATAKSAVDTIAKQIDDIRKQNGQK